MTQMEMGGIISNFLIHIRELNNFLSELSVEKRTEEII